MSRPQPWTEAGRSWVDWIDDNATDDRKLYAVIKNGPTVGDLRQLVFDIERQATFARPDARPVHVITEEHRDVERVRDVERLADFILGKIEATEYQGLHPELASMGLAIAIRDEYLTLGGSRHGVES